MKRHLSTFALASLLLIVQACTVGPKYVKPTVPAPTGYKEPLPENFKEMAGWKVGEPNDKAAKGKWWEIFGDSQLNGLEEQVSVSNQTIKAAEAQFRQARAVVQAARAGLYPTVTGNASVTGARSSSSRGTGIPTSAAADLLLQGTVSWVPDLWGQIHKVVEGGRRLRSSERG